MIVGLCVAVAVVMVGMPAPRRVAATPIARRARRMAAAEAPELSAILTAAAAQLRAGSTPRDAWAYGLGEPVGRVPTVGQLVGRSVARRRGRDAHRQRAAAVVAAASLSDELGAPLAAVLDRVAVGLAADEECEGERIAALAGPRATAQVLAWLPLLGLALGVALGANPVEVVLGGGLGTAAAGVGLALVALGRWWTAALLARAESDDVRRPA